MTITAVIVTYNRLKLLKGCIYALLHQDYKLNNIVVINNDSSDGTKDYLSTLNDSRLIVINSSKNLGGAGGFSLGTKIAYERTSSSYFWLMDDDTIATKSSLSFLCKYATLLKGHFGFLSSNVRWWKNDKAVNIPTVAPDWSELIKYSLIKLKEATFVSLFIPRQCVKELGLPIAEAFIWGDDTEYTHRLSNRYPSYFVPKSIVLHKSNKMDNNENIFNENVNRIAFYRFGYRNLLFIDRKYYSYKVFFKDIIKLFIILFKIPFKAKNYRIKRSYCTIVGLINGLFFNPKVKFPK